MTKQNDRIHVKDAQLRKLVQQIMKIDPRSRTITQVLYNACDEYLKQLNQQQAAQK